MPKPKAAGDDAQNAADGCARAYGSRQRYVAPAPAHRYNALMRQSMIVLLSTILILPASFAFADEHFPVQDAKVIYQSLDAVCRESDDGPDKDAACTVERKVAGILKAQGLCEDDGNWAACDANSN